MRVLVVVERGLADVVRQALEREGHSLALAHSGDQAVEMAKALASEAILVDTARTLDGFKVARMLRAAGILAPILMLIAKDAVPHANGATEAGADDFLIKPFSFAELMARLRAMHLRGAARQSSRLQVADLVLDTSSREVSRGGTPVMLTRTEFQLLEILLRNSDRVLPREELIEALWPDKEKVANNTLDAFIRLLRNKIDRGQEVKLIHTVRGVGYRLSTGRANAAS